ncbi:MAG: DUF1232 domain-containing protein [Cytophagales bacterium]|nr:DUF1232 domain-containing protein [Cytophagales bacterium]
MKKRIRKKAKQLAKNPKQTAELLREGVRLLQSPGLPARFVAELKWMIRMIQASVRKEYPHMPWKTFVLLVGGLLYFVVPVDAVPDFIPVAGWLDDMTVVTGIYRSVSADIQLFKDWSGQQIQ